MVSYPRLNPDKSRRVGSSEYVTAHSLPESDIPRTPERNVRSNSIAANSTGRAVRDQGGKTQLQKQLELIRSVCDSMMEQNQQSSNVQQLRNNLTPSPLYAEAPRRFVSPNPHHMNAVANPVIDPQIEGLNCQQAWLSNNLQTQAFMLNTLNQCCQMLWLQQRELMALRQTVNQLQERVEPRYDNNQSHLASPMESRSRASNQKGNQVSAACSMPNLNQYNMGPPINIEHCCQHNNNQNARLLDPCLNNANSDHINNSVLHGVNTNINQMPNIWNGQALNNQVAPGNRANNYWDNFRR